ncbi:MAG: polysaccharide deacetylase family protein [Dehalococcoidales bacterium]
MDKINFLSKSRGIKNLSLRIVSVLRRFGPGAGRFEKILRKFGQVTGSLDCVPTFAITAVTLKRHPKVIRELSRQGVEFAVHGNVHIDYGVIPAEEQSRHFNNAIDIFKSCGIPFTGFRAPFLRINGETLRVLDSLGFPYDSSHSVHWDVLDSAAYPEMAWSEYRRLLAFYDALKAEDCQVVPRFQDGLIEIPVSIPDDEAMVERLGITGGDGISAVWRNILQKTYDRGELFTLQLHPERIALCEKALQDTIKQARRYDPPVWVTTLKEIAAWWRERSAFKFEVEEVERGRYRVKAACSDRAMILLRQGNISAPAGEWWDGYQNIKSRDFIVTSPARPMLGIGLNAAPAAVSFLKNEGYALEKSDEPGNYSLYLNSLEQFTPADEKPLAEQLERSGATLLRYWRWPDRHQSALTVTGDIDAMTLIDFALRIRENWAQNHRKLSQAAGRNDRISMPA